MTNVSVRGWSQGHFVFERPRAVSRSTTRIDQRYSGFFHAEARKSSRRSLHDPVGGTPRHVCRKIRAKNGKSDLPVFNIKQNLARKLDPSLKPSNLKEITYPTHFYAQKAKCPRPF